MTWVEAVALAKHCPQALAAALEVEATIVPRPDLGAVVMCKEKVRQGLELYCCDLDKCPKWQEIDDVLEA